MSQTFLKPPGGIIQETLKLLKRGFDDRRLDEYEPNLYRGAMLSSHPTVVAWRGEILHQLALRAERRGETKRALELYALSAQAFEAPEYLAQARESRDHGVYLCYRGDPDAGLEELLQAVGLHAKDRPNAKGRRQKRVTEGYVLRARVLAGDDRASALEELTELALFDCRDFCLRDQQMLVAFAAAHTRGAARRALHVRQLEIDFRRRNLVGTGKSIARVVIDKELQLAGHVAGRTIRKEWSLPRRN
mgnify:CR=1 FL=1